MKLDSERPRISLITRAKAGAGAENDADLARLMKVTPQTLSQWKSGQVSMTDERVIQMAALAGDEPELWLMIMSFANAKTTKARKAWGAAMLRVAADIDKMAKGAIPIALVLGCLLITNTGVASASGHFAVIPGLSIMFTVTLLAWLAVQIRRSTELNEERNDYLLAM